MKEIIVRSYTEVGRQPIPPVHLSDDEYGRGLQCFVPACTDIVPVDVDRRVIYLARRQSKPMTGWWWIGGRMIPHETKEESVARNLKRETLLELPINRFKFTAVFDYQWKNRAQKPQEIGCHILSYTFTVELTPDELVYASRHLEKNEYEQGSGLTAFTREQLISENVFQPILDFYDHIFPQNVNVECGFLGVVSSDDRRDIHEFSFPDSVFQDFRIKNSSKPLGQHFHREKFEVFYFLEGGGTIRTAEVDATGKIVGEVRQFEVKPGFVIRIPPGHTHRFDLAPNTRFVAFSSKVFYPNDMISCPIE